MRGRIVLLTVGWVLIAMPAKAVPYFSLDPLSLSGFAVGGGDILTPADIPRPLGAPFAFPVAAPPR